MVTDVTHNHPEGIKGAEATAVAAFMAKQGADMQAIKDYIDANYYPMDFTLDGIRDSYMFNETCQNTVPQALMALVYCVHSKKSIRRRLRSYKYKKIKPYSPKALFSKGLYGLYAFVRFLESAQPL